MSEGTWKCSGCGQIYSILKNSCPVCFITRQNRHVTGKIETKVRTAKPPPERLEVIFPFRVAGARFNLPLAGGAVWSSGLVVFVEAGVFLLSEKDNLDVAAVAAAPPAGAGAVGPLSLYIPRASITRIVHAKLVGDFLEIGGRQKIPLRFEPAGWEDVAAVCDQLGIARE